MKKLFPDMPDVSQSVANRAVRIVEKHLRTHHVSRTRDLPEEAKIRLYRDLRFFFEGDSQSPSGGEKQRLSTRGFLSRLWEKIEDFLSAAKENQEAVGSLVMVFSVFVKIARIAVAPRSGVFPTYVRSE